MENKKIKNATSKEYNGIQFKSLLEVSAYKHLISVGITPQYEKFKFTIIDGFRPTIPFYSLNKSTKDLKLCEDKVRGITYTPDFTFMYKDIFVIIELKGHENDVYPVKRKLFRRWMETWLPNGIFFEVRTIKQLKQAIELIKKYERSYSKNKKSSQVSS